MERLTTRQIVGRLIKNAVALNAPTDYLRALTDVLYYDDQHNLDTNRFEPETQELMERYHR